MAELLVKNHDHWMDALDEKQLSAYLLKYPKFMDKYNARTQKGDIIEIKDDGHFTGKGRGYNKDHFDLVIVKGKTAAELSNLRGALLEDAWTTVFNEETKKNEEIYTPIILKKFKANVPSYTDKAEIVLTAITMKVL